MLPPRRTARLAFTSLALSVALVASACGGQNDPADDSGGASPSTFATTPAATGPAAPRSAPRWETVSTFKGTGTAQTAEFTLAAMSRLWGGIHWRADSEVGLEMGRRIGDLFVEWARGDEA